MVDDVYIYTYLISMFVLYFLAIVGNYIIYSENKYTEEELDIK